MSSTNPVSTVQADSTTLQPTEQKSTGGAAHVLLAAGYPTGATALTGASGNVAASTAAATLTTVAAKTTHIAGFSITGAGATAGLPVIVTVTGTITGTLTYIYTAVAGALLSNTPLHVSFNPPIPASAVNTNIVVSCPTLGAGNTHNAAVAHGYNL